MMHRVLKIYFPAFSRCFTVIILLAGIITLFTENRQNPFVTFAFQMAAYLILTCILDELIGRIDYKTYINHFITESVLLYPVTLFLAVKFKWIGLRVFPIIVCSVIYFFVIAGNHLYFYYMEKNSAEEINRLLEERRDKNV